eukprot:3918443-Rhodomonas_salina.2
MLSTRSWYLLDPHGVRFLLTSCQVLLGRVLKRLNECFSGLEMAGDRQDQGEAPGRAAHLLRQRRLLLPRAPEGHEGVPLATQRTVAVENMHAHRLWDRTRREQSRLLAELARRCQVCCVISRLTLHREVRATQAAADTPLSNACREHCGVRSRHRTG